MLHVRDERALIDSLIASKSVRRRLRRLIVLRVVNALRDTTRNSLVLFRHHAVGVDALRPRPRLGFWLVSVRRGHAVPVTRARARAFSFISAFRVFSLRSLLVGPCPERRDVWSTIASSSGRQDTIGWLRLGVCLPWGWQGSVEEARRRNSTSQATPRCFSRQTKTTEGGGPKTNRTLAIFELVRRVLKPVRYRAEMATEAVRVHPHTHICTCGGQKRMRFGKVPWQPRLSHRIQLGTTRTQWLLSEPRALFSSSPRRLSKPPPWLLRRDLARLCSTPAGSGR